MLFAVFIATRAGVQTRLVPCALFSSSVPGLLRRTSVPRAADVEGCFGILFSLLFKTDNPKAAMPGLSMEIATKVLEKIDDSAPLRLKL